MLGVLTIALEKEIETGNEMERAYCRNALLHRQLSMKMENPTFEQGTFISIQINLASTSNSGSLPEYTAFQDFIIFPCEEINKL